MGRFPVVTMLVSEMVSHRMPWSSMTTGMSWENPMTLGTSLVGALEHDSYFFIQLGILSSQLTLTPSFFRGVGLNHQPDDVLRILDVDHYPIPVLIIDFFRKTIGTW